MGHETPTRSYTIIDKERFHISNIYPKPNSGAKMPYMHRLTNTDIAIHQGYVTNYPTSHGYIRVTRRVAKKLWRWSKIGTEVRVYGSASSFLYGKRYKRYTKRGVYKKIRYNKRKHTKRRRHYVKSYSRYSIVNINDD